MGTITIFIVSLACFIAGMGAGAFLFMKFSPEQQKARNIVKHLHEKQDEFKAYQFEVNQYFSETSLLLKQFSDNYRHFHNHIAKGAKHLCGESVSAPLIQEIAGGDEYSARTSTDPKSAIPPLDYAPRSTPYDRGTLNEEYGIEKVALTERILPDETEDDLPRHA